RSDAARSAFEHQRPSATVAGVSPALERVVMRALSPDPRQRPASAAEMGASLAAASGRSPASRRRIWAAAAAFGVAAALLALVWPFDVRGGAHTLTEQDTILLSDFVNTTGEPVFDGTLQVALAVAVEQSPFIK